ncbi:MFS transporter [Sodalis ligni]|jgi:sugar phosphate permease|uniref:Sugar phosphate permease n=1 Tax=Sodalis ligni TaxID=2697027 RepID=A0A4R1NL43_9GAMM|nr:MFS transporter [Sodalis ligni]TCL05516.1 sugar phosphate permease [Sodalis ligni]
MKLIMFRGATGRVFMLICLMYFIEYIDRVNISIAAPLLKTEMHLSNTQLGLVLSAFGYCYAIFQIINGYMGDKIGPRRMLALSGLFWAAGTLATGLSGGLIALFFSRMLVGLGEAGTIPNATRAMGNWVPVARRGFAQGFTHSSARAAAAITPPIMVALIPLIGWRGAFVVLGGVSLIWVALWCFYFRNDPRKHPKVTEDEIALLPPYSGPAHRTPVPWLALTRRILPVTLVFFCHAWTLWLYLSWLPSFFVGEYGINLKTSALFTSGVFIAGVLGNTAGGLLTDAWFQRTKNINAARRNIIIFAFLGSLAFMSCVLFIHQQNVIALCLAASLFFLELAEGPIWAVPLDVAPAYAGVASGFVSTSAGIAGVVSPLAFGYISDVTGSYRLPFIMSIALLLCGVVLSFWIRPDRPLQRLEKLPPQMKSARVHQ